MQNAVIFGGRQMVAYLLKNGADLDQCGTGLFGESAYTTAMRHKRIDIEYVVLKRYLETHCDDRDAKVTLSKVMQELLKTYQARKDSWLKSDDKSSFLVNIEEWPDNIDGLIELASLFLDVESGTSPTNFLGSVSAREIAFVEELMGHIEASAHLGE